MLALVWSVSISKYHMWKGEELIAKCNIIAGSKGYWPMLIYFLCSFILSLIFDSKKKGEKVFLIRGKEVQYKFRNKIDANLN